MTELNHILATAIDLAELAAPIARAAWFDRTAVDYKADGSALTEADTAIEAAWRDVIARRFPQHGILGEEYGAETSLSAFTWLLDPIDGTRQFGTGLLNFSSLIGICREGDPVLGIIDLPLAGARYIGIEGRGTTLNGATVRCTGLRDLDEAKVGLANPASFTGDTAKGYDRLREAARLSVFDGGSPAYGALARGQLDVCLNGPDLDAYDICALVPVVREAGGCISDWSGGTLGLRSHGAIVASASAALHDSVLSLLS